MLEIVNLRNGSVLNRHHGRETAAGLEITVEGLADPAAEVLLNGCPVERCDRRFRGQVLLTQEINTITASSHGKFGDLEQRIVVAYDKNSFKRCNFFIDDNVFFLTDLGREKPKSIFDQFYLKRLRDIHRESGAKFTLNCFYRNDHDPFEISAVPDCWKSEWADNADWLRLSFHAWSEFPDRPYQHAEAEKLAADFDQVKAEIVRFAGEKTWIVPTVIHWAMLPQDHFALLRERGVRVLAGTFLSSRVRVGEKAPATPQCDIGYFYEQDMAHGIEDCRVLYDPDVKLYLSCNTLCCNLDTPEEIVRYIERDAALPTDFLGLVTHEQYSYPRYFNYIPDHLDRVALACRKAHELGYQFVHFSDGLLGNPAWENA